MSTVFLASYVVGWIILLIVTMGYIRLSAKLRPRDGQLPEHNAGLPEGTVFPSPPFAIDGSEVSFQSPQGEGTVVVMTATTCAACQTLYPELLSFQARHPNLRLAIFMKGPEDQVADVVERNGLKLPVVGLTPALAAQCQAGIFPFAYLLSKSGMVLAKGVVNNEKHLELLLKMGRTSPRSRGRVSNLSERW